MNDMFWNIFYVIALIIFVFFAIFLIVVMIIGIIDICNNAKSKQKYYLIKYRFIHEYEMMIKSKNPLKARLEFHRKYKNYNFISIEEIKDE